jgi:hypothetical protein
LFSIYDDDQINFSNVVLFLAIISLLKAQVMQVKKNLHYGFGDFQMVWK